MLLASAAIPAVFPPGFVKVAAGGTVYDEMHVDGGATREVFLVPTQFMAQKAVGRMGINPIRRAYIIRNGHVSPEYKAVKAKTLSIAGRAVSSLIKSQGVGDLYELFVFAKKNNIDYNLAYIPGDFHDTSTQAFDPVYMTQALRSRLQHGPGRLSVEEGPAPHGRALTIRSRKVGRAISLGVELGLLLAYTRAGKSPGGWRGSWTSLS